MSTPLPLRPRDRDAVLQSLRAGVVPRTGQHLVQVGRVRELETLVGDIDRIADGGSTFRLVVGEYGAGKTFFLNLVRAVALEKKLVVATADLNPDRRLHASNGQARSLYAELMRNLATRTKPDGGALPGVVEKFIATAKTEANEAGVSAETKIHQKLEQLKELVNGFDFADVIAAYCRGHDEGNETLKSDAIRWLRGEFTTKTDARMALGVRTIVDDASVYDQLKLLARFVRLAGFTGLLVGIDELVNLYKLTQPQARNSNYEQILRMLNDSLQGNAVGMGLILGGTPEFLLDPRRGLYSYPALQSRLSQNEFAKGALVDFSGPVVRLASLTPEDFYVLLQKVRHVHAGGDAAAYLIPDAGIQAFMSHCAMRVGEAYFRTPRTTITAFVNLLAVLQQNPGTAWETLVGAVDLTRDTQGETERETDVTADHSAHEANATISGDAVNVGDAGARANLAPPTRSTGAPGDDELASFKL